jgi:hypothetical protein
MFHAQELRPSGGGPGQSVSFPNVSQGAAMASVPASAERTNRHARKNSDAAQVTDAKNTKRRRPRQSLPSVAAADSLTDSQSSAAPVPHSASVSAEDQLDLLWSQLRSQMLELLTHGIAAPFQQRAFDKLDYSMKQYGKLRRERAEDSSRNTAQAEPDAEELAAILNKMDRRIDELAEDRFKKLAGGKLPAPAMEAGRAGMDV